jgi:hypothetical protein
LLQDLIQRDCELGQSHPSQSQPLHPSAMAGVGSTMATIARNNDAINIATSTLMTTFCILPYLTILITSLNSQSPLASDCFTI